MENAELLTLLKEKSMGLNCWVVYTDGFSSQWVAVPLHFPSNGIPLDGTGREL